MEAFATLDELKQRLDWDLDPSEERIATAALADASDEAAVHGRDWPTFATKLKGKSARLSGPSETPAMPPIDATGHAEVRPGKEDPSFLQFGQRIAR